MAIKLDVTRFGINITNAYVKIIRLSGSKDGGWDYEVGIFARNNEPRAVESFGVHADNVNGEHPYATGYTAVKAMPEFAVGADV